MAPMSLAGRRGDCTDPAAWGEAKIGWLSGSRKGGSRNFSMKKFGTPRGAGPGLESEKVGFCGVGLPSGLVSRSVDGDRRSRGVFFFSSRRRHTRCGRDWSSDVCSSDLDEHTGFDLFERLREEGRGRERRIVFTTGDSISLHTRDALQRADRPVLRKPFSLDELREKIGRAHV